MADRFVNAFASNYPYTNFHELNADYILKRLAEIETKLTDFRQFVDEEVAAQIAPFVNELNELNNRFNALDVRVTVALNTYEVQMLTKFAQQDQIINQRFTQILHELNRQINALEANYTLLFNQFSNALTRDNEEFKNDIRTNNADFQHNITESLNIIDAKVDYTYDYVTNQLEQFLSELPESFYVQSPITGTLVTVQEAINQLYDSAVRYRAITCEEFEALGLTAQEYDDLELTAIDFDLYGLDVLPVIDTKHYMYSPFTGEWVTVQTVINELAALHRAYSLTATELDALDLNVTELEAYEYTAFRYDWYSKQIFE